MFIDERNKAIYLGGVLLVVIKIDYNSSHWIRSQAGNVKNKLTNMQKEIANTLDYDVCLSLLFNDSRNVAVVKSSFVKNTFLEELEIPNTVFINKSMYTGIKNLIRKKDIVEVHNDYTYPMLIKGMKSEVYIPIFEPVDSQDNSLKLIGSLYLGSSGVKDFPMDIFFEKKICNLISDISKIYTFMLDDTRDRIKAINIISIFIRILEQKVKYLPNHSYNVANWCREIGILLGYDQKDLTRITYAGLLHDVGKCLIDSDILNKPSKLTEEEYLLVKEHPIMSQRIAKNVLKDNPLLKDVPKIIKFHHERYDGKGYPLGLKEDEVPFDSYILGIADAVDAMLSDRTYKKAMTLDAVIKELYMNRGKQFHPKLVDIVAERLMLNHNQLEVDLVQDMELSSLIINSKENLTIIEGILIRTDSFYIFKPFDEDMAGNIKLANITKIELAIKNLNNISYYDAKLEDIANKEFYISTIKLIPSVNTFSLFWKLDGILYEPNYNKMIPIVITKVGGDSLSFYFDNDQKIPGDLIHKPLRIKILFEDFDIDITGTIVKSHNFGFYRYFYLQYTNIPDSTRDSIYRQLFRKQIELRKSVAQYK